MLTFNANSPLDWQHIMTSEVLAFDVPNGNRTVSMSVTCTARVNVYVAFNVKETSKGFELIDRKLIASATDRFDFSFATGVQAFVQFESPEGAIIFAKGPSASHMVGKTEEPKFTNPFPEKRRNSDLDKIMQLVKHNEKVREAKLEHTLAEIRADKKQAQLEKLEADRIALEAAENEGNTDDLSKKDTSTADT